MLPKLRVSVAERCFYRCVFCGGDGQSMENFQPPAMGGALSTDRLLTLLGQFVANGGSVVQFTGGEPLLRADLDALVGGTRRLGGVPEINTNGVLLSEARARALRDQG